MLIDSPRLTVADRQAWADLERYDKRLSSSPRLSVLEERAVKALQEWWADDDGTSIAGTSWGKDSTVVAHLAWLTGEPIPIVWVRGDPYEPPESDLVRDAFLTTHPGLIYQEIVVPWRVPMRGEPGYAEHTTNPTAQGQDILNEAFGGKHRYASGVRAEESKTRTISIARHGLTTPRVCRPIGRWTTVDVFAYLHRESLPVHPAYAMSYGGKLDRRTLRVHTLATVVGNTEWENRYYGDHLATITTNKP